MSGDFEHWTNEPARNEAPKPERDFYHMPTWWERNRGLLSRWFAILILAAIGLLWALSLKK